jgi:hypothetical protein
MTRTHARTHIHIHTHTRAHTHPHTRARPDMRPATCKSFSQYSLYIKYAITLTAAVHKHVVTLLHGVVASLRYGTTNMPCLTIEISLSHNRVSAQPN